MRKFSADPLTERDLINNHTLDERAAKFLHACVRGRMNIIVSGGTGSGKTTTLNVMSSYLPSDERIVTIEDAAELQLHQEHVLTLEARPANIEGQGAVTIRELVRNTLRMRPDRIVVGEARGGEAPRFEGHQPGRDSVQGRRRCRMRRQSSMVSGRASESVSSGSLN